MGAETKHWLRILIALVILLVALLLVFNFMSARPSQTEVADSNINTEDFLTYSSPIGAFQFRYSPQEQVTPVYVMDPRAYVGQRKILIRVDEGPSSYSCEEGVDTRCQTVKTASGGKAIISFGMSGDVSAGIDLTNGKSVVLSLSCDKITEGMTHQMDYCEIGSARVDEFIASLQTFAYQLSHQ